MNSTKDPSGRAPFRCGYVALAGRPNVGKSTLLNALVGEHLSIVSSKAQTTRERVSGILTGDDYQALFIDGPGLLEPRYALQEAMRLAATQAIETADVVAFIADPTQSGTLPDESALRLIPGSVPVLILINKIDTLSGGELGEWLRRADGLGDAVLPISARTGEGLDEFIQRLIPLLPESPPLFPADEVATQSLRFFAAEFVRETCMELLREEIPYSIVCLVDEFREEGEPVYIRVTIYVERASQKGIVIGRGGRVIRKLGELSRKKIEALIGERVYLDLRVKVMANWSRKRHRLRHLGFRVPREVRRGTSDE